MRRLHEFHDIVAWAIGLTYALLSSPYTFRPDNETQSLGTKSILEYIGTTYDLQLLEDENLLLPFVGPDRANSSYSSIIFHS